MEGTLLINDLMKFIKKYVWVILLFTVIGGLVGRMLVPEGPPPTYKASALVLIEKKEPEAGIVINQTDEIGRFLNTAQTLIETPVVLDNVKKELKLDESAKELADKLEVANENNSHIFRVTAEDANQEKVTKLVNSAAQNFTKVADKYLDVDIVEVVEVAKSGQESKILHTRSNANMVMGVILGLVFGALIAFIFNLTSKKKTIR
ncbi:hypothetical protein HHO41_00820 [Bacillus sp. DNRA2]|uniref:YveK family protein n=1 Tax=Bacillus sp. DNRA2 TaxID=2723053 RepID=UPI00145F4CF3|nr:Wzz/FepE/Etk N-terminal domain-containing protein [Bacillus sp. DNRA2]NMD68810.1 hypothetical protein [Bacillus sp. DNRA2]